MTYAIFQAYAVSKHKNASIVFAEPMLMDDDAMRMSNDGFEDLDSSIKVNPSIIKSEYGDKIQKKLMFPGNPVFFKAETVPEDSGDNELQMSQIDWSTVDFDNGLKSSVEGVLGNDVQLELQEYPLGLNAKWPGYENSKGLPEKSRFFAAVEYNRVVSDAQIVNALVDANITDDAFGKDGHDKNGNRIELEVGMINHQLFGISQSSDKDQQSDVLLVRVNDFEPTLRDRVQFAYDSAKADTKNDLVTTNVRVAHGGLDETNIVYSKGSRIFKEARIMLESKVSECDDVRSKNSVIFENAEARNLARDKAYMPSSVKDIAVDIDDLEL